MTLCGEIMVNKMFCDYWDTILPERYPSRVILAETAGSPEVNRSLLSLFYFGFGAYRFALVRLYVRLPVRTYENLVSATPTIRKGF